MKRVMKLTALSLCVLYATAVSSADWPQWRGPDRNGHAPAGPALADTWPTEGPPRLWESARIPAGQYGGFGCVTVVDGRAYIFAAIKKFQPILQRVLAEDGLKQLGWSAEKLPPELAETVEKARVSDERAKLPGDEVGQWVDQWRKDHLTPEQDKQLGALVSDRLSRGAEAMEFETLDKLAEIKDRRFRNQSALNKWFEAAGFDDKLRQRVMQAIPTRITLTKDTIYCLSAATGEELWKVDYPGRPNDWQSSSTPTVRGERLYVMGSDGMAYCLATADGEELWKARLGKGEKNSSFLLLDARAIVLSEALTALNAETGEVLWTQKKVRGSNNSPMAWSADGKTYVVCNTTNQLYCVDAADGQIVWEAPGGGNSSAVIDGDFLALLSERRDVGLTAYKLSATKAEKLWSITDVYDRGASPLILDGHVYALGGGWALCVELATGTIAWREKTPTQDITSAIFADGKIFAVGGGGKSLLMVRPTPAKWDLLAKVEMDIAVCSSLSTVDGRLFVRRNYCIACYDLRADRADKQ